MYPARFLHTIRKESQTVADDSRNQRSIVKQLSVKKKKKVTIKKVVAAIFLEEGASAARRGASYHCFLFGSSHGLGCRCLGFVGAGCPGFFGRPVPLLPTLHKHWRGRDRWPLGGSFDVTFGCLDRGSGWLPLVSMGGEAGWEIPT